MKAKARKILALVMAMAMVLSLAAPAMAADDSNSLETQASVGATTTWVTAVDVDVKGYAVTTNEGRFPASGFSAWDSGASKDYVTVTATPLTSGGQVGTMQEIRYTVTPVAAFASPSNLAAKTITVADDTTKVKLTDSAIDAKFKEMSTTQDKFSDSGATKQRKGFYYSEAQANGSYKVYFKLYPTQTVGTGTDLATGFDESANHKWYYTVATKSSAPADTDISGLLKSSTLVEPDGTNATSTGYYKDRSTAATAYTNSLATYTETAYTFSVTGLDDIASISFAASKPYAATTTFASGKNVGSFKVRMSTTINDGTKNIVVMEQDRDKVMATMTAAGKAGTTAWTVTSLSDTATNDYWTVGIEKKTTDTSNDYDDAASATDNTKLYIAGLKSDGTTNLMKAALVDTKEAGLYNLNGDSTKKTSISAGTEAFGFVAVYKEKLPTGVATPSSLYVLNGEEKDKDNKVYWTFASVDHMTKAFEGKNSDCGSTKSVPYVQGAVNAKLNGVANGAVNNGAILTPVTNWLAQDNIKTKDGSITLEKADHASYVKEVSTTKETCKKAGAKVTKIVCPVCGDVRATDTVEIARVTTALPNSNVYTAAQAQAAGYTHYIAEVEIVSTPATKDSKGTYTKKYKCNLGEYHEELEETKELDKTTLEHSGTWSAVQWGTQNTASARSPGSLYGYTPFVLDTDVDYTEATLSTKDDVFFNNYNAWSAADGKQIDGTYYYTLEANKTSVLPDGTTSWTVIAVEKVTKDATGKKTKTTAYYMGNAIVSDIKVGEKDCQDGSATITLNIYQATSATYANASLIHPQSIEESLKQKKVTLLKTFTKEVVVPANKTHIDANNDGKCDNCGTAIDQGNTEPTPAGTDISKAVVKFGALTYTGKVAQPTATVTLDGVKLAKGVDYEVEEMQDVKAGTYSLIVKGKGDFTGRVVGNVTINKAAQPMKVSKSTLTFKVKDLKKKAKIAALKVTKNKGKVSYKSSNKKVTWKSSKVTVAKKTKKGTYKLTFTAKGNSNYKAGNKTVKVVVK